MLSNWAGRVTEKGLLCTRVTVRTAIDLLLLPSQEKGLTVCCEPAVMDEPLIVSDDFQDVRDKLITWEDGKCLADIAVGGSLCKWYSWYFF